MQSKNKNWSEIFKVILFLKAGLDILSTRYAGAGAKSKGGYPPRIEERMRAKTIVFAVATRTPQTLVPKPLLPNGIKIFLKSHLILYQICIIHKISNNNTLFVILILQMQNQIFL